jgi:outer membrane protein assembly factor BamB
MKRVLIILLAAALLAACGAEDNTPPPAPLVQFKPRVKVHEAWEASVGSGEEDMLLGLVPAVDGDTVFGVGRDGDVSAWSVKTGNLVWRTDTDFHAGGGPGVGKAVVAVGSTEGYVEALDVKDGSKLWKHYVHGIVISAPAVGHGVVVVRTGDGRLIGLSTADGHKLWSISREVPRISLRGDAAPVIARDTVYAGFDDGSVVAVSLTTGKVLWDARISAPSGGNKLAQMVDIDGQSVVHFGFVYSVTYQGKLAALIGASGDSLWQIPMSSFNGVSYGESHLYVTDADSVVHAVTAASGTKVWKQAAMQHRFLTRPTPFHGTVAVGDLDGYVHFLSQKTGDLVARVQPDSSRISAAPVVAGDTLLVLSDDGDLSAWRFPKAHTPK